MEKLIRPSAISGIVKVPSSKSVVQRAIAIALLANGRSVISNVSFCDDVLNAIKIIRSLGAAVQISDETIIIESCGFRNMKIEEGTVINCGESALSLQMFSAITALFDKKISVTGKKTLLNRSAGNIEQSLKKLGVFCSTDNGFPPVIIKGSLIQEKIQIDASSTSQFLTGLLIALSATGKEHKITVQNLTSKPYIDITLELLKNAGVNVINNNYSEFFIPASELQPISITAESDWSGAAFFAVAGAICGKVELTGLDINSVQGDKIILKYIKKAGAIVTVFENSVIIEKNLLKSFEADCTDTPDLFPPLAALAVHCEGTSIIHGVNRLANKESDRAEALQNEFSKLGIDIIIEKNKLIIQGGRIIGNTVFSHNDHRIVMALAVASLKSESPVCLTSAECVDKSWPGFFEMLSSSGGKIS
ncbi:MAG TPA: 3-phosphoshikimate 1-carboxyvinyltransferase [bacterium]|nr:3-phosphoshikimate 1-carboxyvinyltransferase [bacterium]